MSGKPPRWLFDELDAKFGFTLDVCATAENAKCERYFTRADDGHARVNNFRMRRSLRHGPNRPEHASSNTTVAAEHEGENMGDC